MSLPFPQAGQLIYFMRELQRSFLKPSRDANRIAISFLKNFADSPYAPIRRAGANAQLYENFFLHHRETSFNIPQITRNNTLHNVQDVCIADEDFCKLIHFETSPVTAKSKQSAKTNLPPLLVFAPLSGHFATLLKETVQTLLPHFDVYITAWKNIRSVPRSKGEFDLDTYIDYVIHFCDFLQKHNNRTIHTMAVCQPVVPVLAANAIMAEDKNPALPISNILLAGPVDARINPTAVNRFADEHSTEWMKEHLISTVPPSFEGFGRLVYPGYLQLFNFMAMNPEKHMQSYYNMFQSLVEGDYESAEKRRLFYKEYKTVMDLSAAFFLQTTKRVFKDFALPQKTFYHRERHVNTDAINATHFLCLEGEKDDICGMGQTKAALDIMQNLPNQYKTYRLIKDVGHYGVFNGRRFKEKVLKHIVSFVQNADGKKS